MKLTEVVKLWQALRQTSARGAKLNLLADFIRNTTEDELPALISLLAGLPDLKLNLRFSVYKLAMAVPTLPLFEPSLEIVEVYRLLKKVADTSGRKAKELLLQQLFAHLTEEELHFLLATISGELRCGVSEGMLVDALAIALNLPKDTMKRQLATQPNLPTLVTNLIQGKKTVVTPLQPVRLALAEMLPSIDEVYKVYNTRLALECKLDGVRIQAHKKGNTIRIYSRRLKDITDKFADITILLQGLPHDLILDGEVIGIDKSGKPIMFQQLMRRFGAHTHVNVQAYFFDILYCDRPVIDIPYEERYAILEELPLTRPPRIVTASIEEARKFFHKAIADGYEGIMVKQLDAPYHLGERRDYWIKVKRHYTIDAVIVAAEWGHGRRSNWLSNYHLAVWDESYKSLLHVGKTFKGPTDEEFTYLTKKLLSLKQGESPGIVYVRPELVVEVEFDDIQMSPHYDSGYALRFARIKSIREDKPPYEADSITTLRKIFDKLHGS